MFSEYFPKFLAVILNAPVGMKYEVTFRVSFSNGSFQCAASIFCCARLSQWPAKNTTGKIHDNYQALIGVTHLDIGDVGYPYLVDAFRCWLIKPQIITALDKTFQTGLSLSHLELPPVLNTYIVIAI